MHETERVVRIFHESWDLREPGRGTAVIADDGQFEDVARGEHNQDSKLGSNLHLHEALGSPTTVVCELR